MPILVSTTPPDLPPVDPPPVEPPAPLGSQAQPSMTWTGWTGESFTLAGDFRAATLLEADGRGGMVMPPIEHYSDRSATANGEVWLGYSVLPRVVSWPLIVIADSPGAMREEHSRFMSTMRPDKTGVFTVQLPDGTTRSLELRYMGGGEGDFGTSTYGGSWLRHKITMQAYEPFFYGAAVSESFDYSPGVDFYGGGVGGAPPYYISSSRTIDSATITNPGDVDVYGVWKIEGPFTGATVGIGANTISIPDTFALNQWVEINTDRRIATIVDQAGTNRWADAGVVKFAPLPASSTTDIAISIAGADTGTKVTFTYVPKFWRAW